MNIELVICTKDRPKELTDLLESLRKQSVKPYSAMVVDGSEKPVAYVVERFPDLPMRYFTLRPPSLTRQRNLGIKNLKSDSALVAFLEDDLVLYEDAIERMMHFWKTASSDIGGASFNVVNYSVGKFRTLKSWFLLDSPMQGALLRSGVSTAYYPAESVKQVSWLCGGATVWRREVFESNLFDEYFRELGWNEDVDFSFRVGQSRKLFVVADAKVIHKESQTSRINNFCFGQIQTVHRVYFVKKNIQRFSFWACIWACIGQMMINLARGIFELNRQLFVRSLGNAFGLCRVASGCYSVWIPSQNRKS